MKGSFTTAPPRSGSKKAAGLILADSQLDGRSSPGRKIDAACHPHRHRPALHFATAVAQELTAEQRSACMGDYEKYCKGVAPGGGRIIACLAKESDKLTPACKKVLAAAEKK